MDKVLSTKAFIISQILILLISLIFIGGLYSVLYWDRFIPQPLQSYIPVTTKPASFSLEITAPDDEVFVTEKDILITGTSLPYATIIISNGDNNLGLVADAHGEFSKVVELSEGLNEIVVGGFDEKGNSDTQTRTVFFSLEDTEEES